MKYQKLQRRDIKTRSKKWAKDLAHALAGWGVTANVVSLMSIVFSAAACGLLLLTRNDIALVLKCMCFAGAALNIQLRLLCNMLDGLLALEEGLKTKLGDIYNEVPDRLDDTIILVGAGVAVNPHGVILGLTAALLAVMTAYVRLLGTALGTKAYFNGPLAKPQRMFVLTVACLVAAVTTFIFSDPQNFIGVALVVVIAGSVITMVRRLNFIAKEITKNA